jgi:hypothetical protein
MRRFIQRKNIKFRKRKCGKERTAEECVADFEKFLTYVRFSVLPPREGDGAESRCPLWGRFPPERRYNMDQVPLPFVNGQDETFTTADDDCVNLKCPKEELRKRQFTMHLVFNAGNGPNAHGWCDLVCKGTGTRIPAAEKDLWDKDIKMFWQQKAWVDSAVMRQLAHLFVAHKKEVHGEDVWVLLFCDNLKAHLDQEVKQIFGDGKVLLCYLPPNMTNFIQPIDAGLGRSVRCAVARELDDWLMDANNMMCWEGKMTAAERRILISVLVQKAMRYVMGEEMKSMRIGCFERTGCLITWLPNDIHDTKVRPQGMPQGSFTVPTNQSQIQDHLNDETAEPEAQDEEEAALDEEQRYLEEEENEEGECEMENEDNLNNQNDG